MTGTTHTDHPQFLRPPLDAYLQAGADGNGQINVLSQLIYARQSNGSFVPGGVFSLNAAISGAWSVRTVAPTDIPEPATMSLMLLGVAGLAASRRRRRCD
jgi:hypothetical protein